MRHGLTAGCLAIACALMALTWRTPAVWPALAAVAIAMGAVSRERGDLGWFLGGAITGSLLDLGQSALGATTYAERSLLGLVPTFVPLYWGIGALAVRHLCRLAPAAPPSWLDAACFVGILALSLAAGRHPMGVAAIAGVLAVTALGLKPRVFGTALLFGLMGPALEGMLIASGLYHLSGAAWVPLWLPAVYAGVGAAAPGTVAVLESVTATAPRRAGY